MSQRKAALSLRLAKVQYEQRLLLERFSLYSDIVRGGFVLAYCHDGNNFILEMSKILWMRRISGKAFQKFVILEKHFNDIFNRGNGRLAELLRVGGNK